MVMLSLVLVVFMAMPFVMRMVFFMKQQYVAGYGVVVN